MTESSPQAASGRADDVHRVLDAVWRMESPRLIAALTRIVRDVGLAEDLAQDALEAAIRQWPEAGIPDRPAAWLMGTAKHRAIDVLRRRTSLQRKTEELGRDMEMERGTGPDLDAAIDDAAIGDDLLRLVFICCHPVLSVDARVALTLRLLGGLRTDEIARAFLASESAIGQRIVRAKRTLSEARVPFEVPQGADFDARLASVLQVIYLVFNEGYSATSGDDWVRPALCEDALRLGRVLAGLVPDEPEVHGLVALMEIQASRIARTDGRRPADRSPSPSSSALDGTDCSSIAAWPPWPGPSRSRDRLGPMSCRRRSRPAMRARGPRTRPTGPASWPSTTRSRR